ncbi:hypothetical protein EON66_09210, partial [archaeon]
MNCLTLFGVSKVAVYYHACFSPCVPRRAAKRASSAYPRRAVSVCHSYDITYKHTYKCTVCAQSYGRHSKSIDPARHRCGKCHGALALSTGISGSSAGTPAAGTPQSAAAAALSTSGTASTTRAPATPSAYQLFMKSTRGSVAAAHPEWQPQKVLAEVGRLWSARKQAQVVAMGGDDADTSTDVAARAPPTARALVQVLEA